MSEVPAAEKRVGTAAGISIASLAVLVHVCSRLKKRTGAGVRRNCEIRLMSATLQRGRICSRRIIS